MDEQTKQAFDSLNKKVDAVYVSAEKTRKYILWTAIITAAVIIIPLFFIPFALSSLISTYGGGLAF